MMTPQIFTEEIKLEKQVLVDAKSYEDWTKSILPMVSTMQRGPHSEWEKIGIKVGDRTFYYRTLPTHGRRWRYSGMFTMPPPIIPESDMIECRVGLDLYAGPSKRGKVYFTEEVAIPVLLDRTGKEVWMSLTPNEVITQRPGIKRAKGNVLVAGLGMGWFAIRCLERKQVGHVTVVDIDQHVLEYFGQPIKERFGDRVTLIHGDAYDQKHSDYDSLLFDIWMGLNDKPWDRKFEQLKKSHPSVWGWGYAN